jgi:hypothetical protein
MGKFFSSISLWTIFNISFPKTMPVVDMKLIGRKFWGNLGSLPGFGSVIIFASFQDAGK